MTTVKEKILATRLMGAYFENPPITDYLSVPTLDHPGVLACSIEKSPAWPAMQAIAMLTKEQHEADRLRRHVVRLGSDAFDVDAAEQRLDPAFPVPKTLVASELPVTAVRRNAKPVRFTPREFRRKADPALLGMTAAERTERINLYRTAMRMMVDACDWDTSLEIAGPKIADQLMFITEKMLFNVQGRLRETASKINAVARQTMGDEIPRQQLERLEWQQAGYRVQERHFEMMAHAFKLERDVVVASYEQATDRSWGAYEGIKARAERSARAWRDKNRRRSSLSMVIENMSDEEWGRWVDNNKRYEPRLDGVAASDDAADEDMRGVDTTGWGQTDWEEYARDDD